MRICMVALMILAASVSARAEDWTLRNITKHDYRDEVFRLPLPVPPGDVRVLEDGKPIPSVVDEVGGVRSVYVRTTLPPGASHRYAIQSGKPAGGEPCVTVREEADHILLENKRFAVRVPRATAGGVPPAPIRSVRLGGKWVGRGRWTTTMPFKDLKATVVDDGRVMGRVRLRYAFGGTAGIDGKTPAFAEVDVTVLPGCPFAAVEERHAMARGSAWEYEVTAGWKATGSLVGPHFGGYAGVKRDPEKAGTLKPGQAPFQPPSLLLNLVPRWNQHYKDGWYCAARDGGAAVGAVTVLAGRWRWPHDNAILCSVKESADGLTLRCPTRRGARYWWLAAGAPGLFEQAKDLAVRRAYESLDTIVHEVPLREWPGVEGTFRGYWPLSGNINPSSAHRGWGKRAIREVGRTVRSVEQLTQTQVLFSPNTYGSYWLFWSPENPNFFTDFNKVPIGLACTLREHPRFDAIARLAVARLREDVYHSIALPSGSGNECPGYQQYALKHYLQFAEIYKKYLGADPMTWPRLKAGARFLVRLSQPVGGGARGSHPGGDTHPKGYVFTDPRAFAKAFGVEEDVARLRTEELQNFGVVFRNRCGTNRETYLAFKSGPGRGHYHGDQLSFHYGTGAAPAAVDHHCSYNPRAGQEHMHNRLAFHTPELPWANMDGYERVIAFKASDRIDVAIGQVESLRLRSVKRLPPENWHEEYPQVPFDAPLKYRRTIVQVKGDASDYFVIRDQYAAGRELGVTYCLHVLGDSCRQEGHRFRFDRLSLVVVAPADYAVSRLDWSHENGRPEATKGLRLTVKGKAGEFVTVLHPGEPPACEALPGGVRVGQDVITFAGGIDDADGTAYVTAKAAGTELILTGKEIDMDRSQGEIGLFVPDAGYPFGEIPDWLIRQRCKVPDWAKPEGAE